ncbi:MAG: hypothetical protein EOO89_30905 [Pedobacter sp.]|nr:MAG: hypothetical protein EOO89_30905 [Pedobacter sp.]
MKIIASIFIGLLFIGAQPHRDTPNNTRVYVANYENVLGTSLALKFIGSSEIEAEKAEQAALVEIDRLSSIFSAYDPNSEFSKWMKNDLNKPVKVSKELFDMLQLFEEWKKRTNGAIDASSAVASSFVETGTLLGSA